MPGAVHNAGSWVFAADEEDAFLPMRVLESFKEGESTVLDYDGRRTKMSAKETKKLIRMDEQSLNPIENMVQLKELNEASILHNLRMRFERNDIYTNVGSILVSVNPFKLLPLYTAEVLDKYKSQGSRDLPPHVYGVADMAYRQMVSTGKDQSCIVSGESGAGKTEATKIFLQYIAEVSGADLSAKNTSFEDASLQEQILKANPLMEAFGNAKTIRNNNSSRFGKWIEVKFNNSQGSVIGGQILQYLLEKSRVVSQSEGERNYHIFYNICAGAQMDKKFKEKFRLGDADEYHYLNQSGVVEVEGISDERDFETVLGAMETIGIGVSEQDDVIRTIAGILHLGNINFAKGGSSFEEGSKVSNRDMLELAAAQLGVSPEKLEDALCFHNIRTNRETMKKALNVDKATDSRDVLAKEVYAKVFVWLIKRINKSLAKKTQKMGKTSKSNTSIIGVLDIFGFESFAYNSFEQLCINYCNEKLQFHFNDFIFKVEQEEYRAEGVDVSQIDFADNQPTIDLFEKKPSGIFSLLDEEMNVPRGNDAAFLSKLTKAKSRHPNYKGPGVKTNYERESFTVVHYAGEVMYNVTAFLEKNRDKLSQDIQELLNGSKIKFVSSLTDEPKVVEGRGTSKSKGSLGSKFKNQLEALMKTLNATDPHFVRCIKPNDNKIGDEFSAQMILDQLRYAGLLEVCRIRQIGYPVRKGFKEFYRRYLPLSPSAKDAKALTSALTKKGYLEKGQFQLGKSKVFLRNEPHNDLEAAREIALRTQAVLIQKIVRRFLARCTYVEYLATLDDLRDGIRKRDYDLLKAAMEASEDLPNQGSGLKIVSDAWELLQTLEEEKRVRTLLQDAIDNRDINALKSAIAAAEDIQLRKCTELTEAHQLVEDLLEEKRVLESMKEAIDSRDVSAISKALKKAESLGLRDTKEMKQAKALLERLEEESRVTKALEDSLQTLQVSDLKDAVTAALDIGIDSDLLDRAQQKLDDLLNKSGDSDEQERVKEEETERRQERERRLEEAKQELIEAAQSKDVSRLADARAMILELGMQGKEVDELIKQADLVEGIQDYVDELRAAINTLNILAESKKGITLNDVKPLSRAIKDASQGGLTEDVPELKEAVSLELLCMERIVVQKELQSALDSGKLDQLKRALDHAGDLDMNIGLVHKVKQKIKDLDNKRPVSERVPQERKQVDMDEDEFERHRNINMQKAQHERYQFQKYYKIRTDGDYARGTFFNKRKVTETKLSYQKSAIPKSILELDKDLNKLAIAVHKSILGYTGEQLMSFPATLAQDVLIKGLEQPELVDEIYIQLCKHLTNNPKPESVGRAWQLVCMAVGTFPPSKDFEFYLLNFFLEHVGIQGLVGNYARYSLRRLDGMLIRGASGFVPNIEEILAYKERPPILATIELVDGTPLTEDLPITPDLSVAKVLEICSHFLSLQDERASTFGIFVVDVDDDDDDINFNTADYSGYSAARQGGDDEPAPPPMPHKMTSSSIPPRTPRPLRNKDYLGDVVVAMTRQHIKFTFQYKRKLFLSGQDGPSKDPVFMRLSYLQAADEIISGNIPVTKETDVVLLTAMAIACDNDKFPTTEKELLNQDLISYLPVPWRTKKSDERWASTVLAMRSKVAKKSLDALQAKYIDIVHKMPLYGYCFFYVRKEEHGADMICAVNHQGVTFLNLARKKQDVYRYSDLHRWGGSSTLFWLVVSDLNSKRREKISLYTSQARDISSLVLDYAVLAADKYH
mmetsp:Transcript_14360/g.26611  ORF Transcript_14360/g.26611 Transcript_14360/m.26611 type:complete len:1731 (+) Transcript_14360:285-5477(+)